MATFRGIIEDSSYAQHPFTVEAETKAQAEDLAIFKIAEELGDNLESFEILVCSEVLTQAQADQYEKDNPAPVEDPE